MQAYHPSNHVPPVGLVGLLVATLLGGALIGALVYAVAHVVYLIILFPIGMGLAGGFIISTAVNKMKMRNPLVATMYGLLIGFVIFGTYMYLDYREFRSVTHAEIAAEFPDQELDPVLVQEFIDEAMVDEVGASGFVGYLLLQAEEGISIGRVGRDNDTNIGSTLTWIYWAIELLIIAGLAALSGRKAAGQPFCESHTTWYGKKARLGGVNEADAPALVNHLHAGSYEQVGAMLTMHTAVPSVELLLERCPHCDTNGARLTLERHFVNEKGKAESKQVLQGMISQTDQDALVRSVNAQERQSFSTPAPHPA